MFKTHKNTMFLEVSIEKHCVYKQKQWSGAGMFKKHIKAECFWRCPLKNIVYTSKNNKSIMAERQKQKRAEF